MIYDVNITELKRVFFAAYFDWLYSYDTVKIYRQLKKKKKKDICPSLSHAFDLK